MIKEIKGYIKKELTIVFYSCRIQLTSTDVENKILGESTMKTKFMTLMTVATLGIFSAATVMQQEITISIHSRRLDLNGKKQIRKVPMQAIRTEMIM